MEKLNRLKGAIKSSITKLETFVQEHSQRDIQNITVSELEVKLKKIEALQNRLDHLREDYYDLPNLKEIPDVEKDIEDTESRLENLEVRFRLFIDSLKKVNNSNAFSSECTETKIESKTKVKLPEIPLPIFTGKYEEWSNFKTQFEHLIVNNEHLNETQKLFYLRASLKGNAKQIETSDDSFESLFTALTERFENLRLLVDTHVLAIINYNKIHVESSTELRNLVDCLKKNLRALKVLKYEQNSLSDVLLINIVLQKLDKESRKQFEYTLKSTQVPEFETLLSFLEKRSSILESVNRNYFSKNVNKFSPPSNKTKSLMINVNDKHKPKLSCVLCNLDHYINKCPNFQKLDVNKRYEIVKEKKLCVNCLKYHHINSCYSKISCMICCKRHHSMLCREQNVVKNGVAEGLAFEEKAGATFLRQTESSSEAPTHKNDLVNKNETTSFQSFNNTSKEKNSVLLSTVYLFIENNLKQKIRIRCILDSASNINCLTNECADMLGIKRKTINAPVSGLNGLSYTIKSKINTTISNAEESFVENTDFFIVPKITDLTPAARLDISNISLPNFIELADPTFYKPGKIQGLVGGEYYYKILKHNTFSVNDKLLMCDTVFGWIATGTLNEIHSSNNVLCCLIRDTETIDDTLKSFWELESIGIKHDDPKNSENDQAMKIFEETTTFKDGRYQVELPWKKDRKELNLKDNFIVAKRRLQSLQKRLYMNPELRAQYNDILVDYLKQGIIERVDINETQVENNPIYYLPHQAVFREDSLTTKTRIVFDASSHDNNELSLNDLLWPGPNLNPHLFDLLIQFRLNKIAISADIEKAFLQVSLSERDRNAVRFLWFEETDGKCNLQIYRFTRVLFGVNASPFLLSATIKKHLKRFEDKYPVTTRLLDTCIYVDDFLSSEDNLSDVLVISREAKAIMSEANMNLRKWITNDTELMELWKQEGFDVQSPQKSVNLASNSTKVLGLSWDTKEDCLIFDIQGLMNILSDRKDTKRFLLKAVGKLFDPLGLLTPFTVRIKCLIQELWLRKIQWDAPLPPDIQREWLQWCNELPKLVHLKIPRLTIPFITDSTVIELHAFCDASKRAYGAAVYLRVITENEIRVNLVASKSRVAPLKKISLPRLELLGALLASRLTNAVKKIIEPKVSFNVFYWTDSKITLYWIKGSIKRWKQFVGNRVKEINSLTDINSWFYCPGKENISADAISRGASVDALLDYSFWWNGPNFLTSTDLPITDEDPIVPEEEYLCEMKKDYVHQTELPSDSKLTLSISNCSSFLDTLFQISNNFTKIKHVLVFLFRFFNNCKRPKQKSVGPLTYKEVRQAEQFLIKEVQKTEFQDDLRCLIKNGTVSKSSKIKNLAPFLDRENIIRVGGRLTNSSLSYCSKHPILLPSNCKLTKLIIKHYHEKYLHSGPQALLFQLRQKYWPLNGRNLCRKVTHDCLTCFKANPQPCTQKMGDLPKERINPDFTFNSVGIDLCGPFFIKNKNQRKGPLKKIYVCIFICLVTKAIHLEIISDLTSESMIATLKRFIARRGKCSKIFSDNATNFVGANKELRKFHNIMFKQNDTLAKFFSEENIEWRFIPPRAPNFGGLWEAGVKSFKYYLKRVASNSNFTYEEFLTIMVQVEAMLNSRPLTPLSSDIEDLNILTPGHFLVGRSLTSIVEPTLVNIPENRLNLWQKTVKAVQLIWRNWHKSYLSTLQQRTKWMFPKQNVRLGDMVILREENLPTSKWIVGRIITTYPGKDNNIRVADVKTKTGIFKRPVTKLCVLPLEE